MCMCIMIQHFQRKISDTITELRKSLKKSDVNKIPNKLYLIDYIITITYFEKKYR